MSSDKGTPVLKPQLACLFEHATDGPAWRRSENGVISGRTSRELVLRTSAVADNYDYLLDWIFQQDGSIRVAVGATGIVETKAVKEEMAAHQMCDGPTKLEHGTLVAPNLVAVSHDHYFSYRLDLDFDGTNNNCMIDRLVPEELKGGARKSIWASQASVAHTEKDAILDLNPHHPGMWHFMNPNHHGALGYPSGYEIMPGATAVSFLSPDDPAQKMGAFSEHQMWVTPYRPNELYAGGTYVTTTKERKDSRTGPRLTAQSRTLIPSAGIRWVSIMWFAWKTGRSCPFCGTTSSSAQPTSSIKIPR